MRAVLDTNVIVSGLLSPRGNARLTLAMAFARKFDLIVSEELFAEYEVVIRRPKFRFRSDEIDEALAEIRRVGEVVKPTDKVSESPDETDNRFLECAATGSADYLVTGNISHFPKKWGRTQVVTVRRFLEVLTPGLPPNASGHRSSS
jgi:putative PIN family toxin of toxin-antitoxin system